MRRNTQTRIRKYTIRSIPDELGEPRITDYSLDRVLEEFGLFNYGLFFIDVKNITTKKISDTHYKVTYTVQHLFYEDYGQTGDPSDFEYDLFIQEN